MTEQEIEKEIEELQQKLERYKWEAATADGALQAFRYILAGMRKSQQPVAAEAGESSHD